MKLRMDDADTHLANATYTTKVSKRNDIARRRANLPDAPATTAFMLAICIRGVDEVQVRTIRTG